MSDGDRPELPNRIIAEGIDVTYFRDADVTYPAMDAFPDEDWPLQSRRQKP